MKGFGSPYEWESFLERHKPFFERFANLRIAMDLAFHTPAPAPELSESAVLYLGRLCVEDFKETLLLCGNGYGYGGLKVLRGMYERAVMARYIHLHPDVAEDFFDFFWVTKHKMAKAIEATFGKNTLPSDKLTDLDTQYQGVREKFLVHCPKCGARRVNHTWSKLDFVSMANEVGSLGKLVVPAYYAALPHTHSSIAGIISRMEWTDEGLGFSGGAQREEADKSLWTAHCIVLDALALQTEHFGLPQLAVQLEKCFRDFRDIWDPTDQC